jgi:hypothetical protein
MKKPPYPKKKPATMIPDPNDSWAQVELYRWQHGELPPQNGTCKKLDEPTALRAMADAIELGCKTGDVKAMPSAYNVCSVLRYAAKILHENLLLTNRNEE